MYSSYVICPKLYKTSESEEISCVAIETCRSCKSHQNKGIFSNHIGCNAFGCEMELKIHSNF